MKVDPSLLHRLFYPQVPAILSAQFGGRVSAMPVVSYASVSTSPPMVAVGCDPASFTYRMASKSRAFSLCLLDRRHISAVERLARTSGRSVKDKLAEAGLNHKKGVRLDVPVIGEAEATMECEVSSKRKTGDHIMLFGLVRACYASGDFSDFWDFEKYKPILYSGWRDGMTTYPGG